MKNLMYVLLALALLYYGLQQITLADDKMQMVFAMSWLCLAVFVIGGNFVQYLYQPKKRVGPRQQLNDAKRTVQRKRQRQTVR